MNFKNYVILHSCKIGINIFNILFTSFSSINISKEVPNNLECVPLDKWLIMRNQVKKIYIKTNENITKLKVIIMFFSIITYYYYYFILIIISSIYFMFYAQNSSRQSLFKMQKDFNDNIFSTYNLKIFFKIDYLNIYLYVVKPRTEMTEILQDGFVIDIESINTDLENLPRATARQISV